MFAQVHHKAMRYTAGPRRELGLRTLFNMLGPLTNPAGVKRQVVGVFNGALCRPLAEVLQRLGSEHVLVVHSRDGLDEFSLASATQVAELRHGEIREYEVLPEDVGLKSQSLVGLTVDGPAASLALVRDALGKRATEAGTKAADMIALNAGAAIYVSGVASDLAEGVVMAQDIIASGLALEKLTELAMFTDCLGDLE